MEKTNTVKVKKKNVNRKINVWWSMPIIVVSLIVAIGCVYYYYRTPKYDYPKNLNTYILDRKCTTTPDGAYNVFLYAVNTNDPELCRAVVRESAVKEYAIKYYKGIFDNDCFRYVLERTNEDITNEYGEDWYNNMVIGGVETNKVKDLIYGKIIATCNGKPFNFSILTRGFNYNFTLDDESVQALFDKYIYDDERRPPYKYRDFSKNNVYGGC